MKVLFELLDEFKRKGNKVLIFSKTKMFLNLLEKMINNGGGKYSYRRLDGDVGVP
jgi:SNF2 family DNA or RNA helicase